MVTRQQTIITTTHEEFIKNKKGAEVITLPQVKNLEEETSLAGETEGW
jgi:hypothetical protein